MPAGIFGEPMASFKLNLARIRNCPPPAKLAAAMKSYGLPESEEFGVLNFSSTDQSVTCTLLRKSQSAVQKFDKDSGELTSAMVEKAVIYPFAIKPVGEVLETYAGTFTGIEQVGAFLASALALNTVVETIELDVAEVVQKLAKSVQHAQLRSVRVTDFAHNSYMAGGYSPKFLSHEHGMEFLEEYAENVQSASVKFAGPGGKVTVSITPKACFSYSCNEEDVPAIQMILRKLI